MKDMMLLISDYYHKKNIGLLRIIISQNEVLLDKYTKWNINMYKFAID